jgi:hypothetical protein
MGRVEFIVIVIVLAVVAFRFFRGLRRGPALPVVPSQPVSLADDPGLVRFEAKAAKLLARRGLAGEEALERLAALRRDPAVRVVPLQPATGTDNPDLRLLQAEAVKFLAQSGVADAATLQKLAAALKRSVPMEAAFVHLESVAPPPQPKAAPSRREKRAPETQQRGGVSRSAVIPALAALQPLTASRPRASLDPLPPCAPKNAARASQARQGV